MLPADREELLGELKSRDEEKHDWQTLILKLNMMFNREVFIYLGSYLKK